jgi:putative heme-binding domain-containing protein
LRNPSDEKLRPFFLNGQKPSVEVLQALRGLAVRDNDIRKWLLEACKTQSDAEFAAQAALALKEDELPEEVRSRLEPRPKDVTGWRTLLNSSPETKTSAERGRSVFFHPQGPGCSRCHTIDGRGGKVGPDLTRIGKTTSREKLLDSILEPSREVAPQFTSWQFVMTDGRLFTGMIVHENEGKTIVGDAEGKTTDLATIDIEERRPQKPSVMPERLTDRMTIREFRDLLAFLQATGS